MAGHANQPAGHAYDAHAHGSSAHLNPDENCCEDVFVVAPFPKRVEHGHHGDATGHVKNGCAR